MAETDKKYRIVSGDEFDKFKTVKKEGTDQTSTIFNEADGGGVKMEKNCGESHIENITSFVGVHDGSATDHGEYEFPYNDPEKGVDEKLYAEVYAINGNKYGTKLLVTNESAYLLYKEDKNRLKIEKGDEILTGKEALKREIKAGDGIKVETKEGDEARTVSVNLGETNSGLTFTGEATETNRKLTVNWSEVAKKGDLDNEIARAKDVEATKADLPGELPIELQAEGEKYPWVMINLDQKGIDAEGKLHLVHSGYNFNKKAYYTWPEKVLPMAATTTTGGVMTAADKVKLDGAALKSYVDEKDEALAQNIANEAKTRSDNDTALNSKIDAEENRATEAEAGKIDLLGSVPGHTDLPYNLPYFFETTPATDKIKVTAKTISLDNKQTQGEYSLDVPAATTTTAGLMTSTDKLSLNNHGDKISAIESKIPTEASSTNKLADKAFVEDKIQTETATFRGNFDTKADLDSYDGIKDNNDYAVVLKDETHDDQTWRYKFNGTEWIAEYKINNKPFTIEQMNAINSGINSEKVAKYDAVRDLLEGDSEKTGGNPVRIPYYFNIETPTNNSITVKLSSVYLDGNAPTYEVDKYKFTLGSATQTTAGLMSAVDKEKLNSLEALPIKVKNKYLHTNDSTGALEWVDVASGEPAAYLKDAVVGGNRLDITKKDGTHVYYTPDYSTLVTKEISGTKGKAIIFNESDGGGAKFEANNGIEAFVGVNDSGHYFQTYVDKSNGSGGWTGSTIKGYLEKYYYFNQANRSHSGESDISKYEIAIKADIDEVKKVAKELDSTAAAGDYILKAHKDATTGNITYEWMTYSFDNK